MYRRKCNFRNINKPPNFSGWGWNISCHFRRYSERASHNFRSVQTNFTHVYVCLFRLLVTNRIAQYQTKTRVTSRRASRCSASRIFTRVTLHGNSWEEKFSEVSDRLMYPSPSPSHVWKSRRTRSSSAVLDESLLPPLLPLTSAAIMNTHWGARTNTRSMLQQLHNCDV